MEQRFGTIYKTDEYVEIEVLDDKGLATYAVIDSKNSDELNFNIDKAYNEPSYVSDWLDNNEKTFFSEWREQQCNNSVDWI